MLHRGFRAGVYEIVSLFGSGGMGEVCRARDPRLERDVAIKLLEVEPSCDAIRREPRFLALVREVGLE